jgi:hypothetical protein
MKPVITHKKINRRVMRGVSKGGEGECVVCVLLCAVIVPTKTPTRFLWCRSKLKKKLSSSFRI